MTGSLIRRIAIRLLIAAVAITLVAACARPEKPKPVELGLNVPLLGVKVAWASDVGQVEFPLEPRVHSGQVFLASSKGSVAVIDALSGGDVWRTNLNVTLVAGVGTDGRYVAVVSADNELIVLMAGKELWRQKLNAVTLTAPLVAGDRVFALSADRTVSAFDAVTGQRIWQQKRNSEALILNQSGIIFAANDTLVVGIGGRLLALSPQNGNIRWDVPIANSRGTNEIERLVDLVSGVSRVGNDVCVRAFQSSVGCADAGKGSLQWSKSANGSTGVGGDATVIFGSENDGRIVAWRRSDGERLWVSDRLRFRKLTAPVLVGRSLVVGDETGTLHFLSREDGSPLNRVGTDNTPIAATPVLVGQTLVAVTRRGGVFGFRPE